MSLQFAAEFGIMRRVSFVVVCAVLAASTVRSQQVRSTASLKGTVCDEHGVPVSGAAIRLQPIGGAQTFSVVSDSSGAFSLSGLPEGRYAVSAEMKGYKRTEISSFKIRPGVNETHITLAPGESGADPGNGAATFYDEPKFTVSGVTDTTSLGGHGSDTVVRARDSLAKETVALGERRESKPAAGPSREELEGARDRAQALVARDPQNAEPHHQLADAEEKLGDSLAAVHEYQRAAELDARESYLFDWGSELLLHHAPEPALQIFTKGNHLFPNSERMLLGMGAAWFGLGSIEEAVRQIRVASDLNPGDTAPYWFLGRIEDAEKVPSQAAVEMLRRFVRVHPESAEGNCEYATLLWRSRPDAQDEALAGQVEALLNEAIRLDPKLVAAYVEMGTVHEERREFQKALADYRRAIEIGVLDADGMPEAQDVEAKLEEAHFRLARVYRQIGEGDKARAELQFYEQTLKASERKTERERHQIPQFVYTLRDQSPPPAP
jgi:tetratricopeptide (TPR) repeat protein